MTVEEALKFAQDFLIYAENDQDFRRRAVYAQMSIAAATTAEAMMRQEARQEWLSRQGDPYKGMTIR